MDDFVKVCSDRQDSSMHNPRLMSLSYSQFFFSFFLFVSIPRLSLPLVFIILSWSLTSFVAMACPMTCQCIPSRQEMICHKGKLADIYVDLDPSLKRLTLESVTGLDVLSLIDLESIKSSLLTLKIKDCAVKTIPNNAFANFKQMEELDLSGNDLISLEVNSFSGLSDLTTLNLSGNRLLSVSSSLYPLSSLKSLDLSSNSLTELQEDTFLNQTSLNMLFLNGNPLKNLDSASLKGLSELRELHLRDCSLISVQDDLFLGKGFLRDLDLGQNRLGSFLSTTAISNLTQLSTLFFDNNEIQRLTTHLFKDLHLQMLDLSYNRINSIDDLAFYNSSIKELDLSYNMIFSISHSFLAPLSTHISSLNLAGNPMGKFVPDVFSDLQLLKSLNISSCRLDSLGYETFKDLNLLDAVDASHNNLHLLSQEMLDFLDKVHVVNLHENAWICDCGIKPLSKWLRNPQSKLKLNCPLSRSQHQDCNSLRCAMPSQFNKKLLVDLRDKDFTGCESDGDSGGLSTATQGAIVGACMGFAVILLIITICLWKKGKTHYSLKRVCVPSNAESSHVLDEDDKVPPLSNCDRVSLNESDHSFVVRHYFDTLVTDPKLMSRTSDSEEPTSPKERDSLYSSQPSLYSHPSFAFGIESTV